jgi:hypothetical protein
MNFTTSKTFLIIFVVQLLKLWDQYNAHASLVNYFFNLKIVGLNLALE